MKQKFINALLYIYDNIKNKDLLWVLTGSFSFALQGLNVEINDIDIQTDEESAYKFQSIFKKFVIDPVQFLTSENIRSHFGIFEINGVRVEIMGDIQKKLPTGEWEDKINLLEIIETVNFKGRKIPVLSLTYEERAYRLLGRNEKADMIKNILRDSPKKNLVSKGGIDVN